MKFKLVCLTIFAITSLIMPLSSNAKVITFSENFSQYDLNQKPENWIFKETGGTAFIKSIKADDKNTNFLYINDTDRSQSSGVTALRKFPNQKGKAALELKFRLEREIGSLEFTIGGGDSHSVLINISSDGTVLTSNSDTYKSFSNKIKLLNWNTLRVLFNPRTGKYNARINNETLYDLNLSGDYKNDGIDFIILKTTSGVPELSVDYINVESGEDLDVGIQPIEAPLVDDPVPYPLKDKINIKYNGEYMYFDYAPIIESGRVLIPLRKVFEMFKMEVSWDEKTNTAICMNENTKIEVQQGSKTAYVNDSPKTLDVEAKILDDIMYVPLRFISESIGAEVSWDDATNTVIINR